MRSLSAVITELYMNIAKMKERYNVISDRLADNTLNYIDEKYDIGKYVKNVTVTTLFDRKVYVINDGENKDVLFYLHGGGYVNPPSKFHYRFLNNLSKKLGLKIVMPLYGRVPDYNCKTELPKLADIYLHFLSTSKGKVYMGGDSAGGGLAVALTYYLREKGLKLPKKLILFSPFMDMSATNPEIKAIDKHDRMLAIGHNTRLGELWSENDIKSPYASPLYGDVSSLPETVIYTGTYDILYPDMKLFVDKLNKYGVKNKFDVKDKMGHVYVLYPITEAKRAFKKICSEFK